VDRHEKPATVAYRVAFISRYFEYERRTHRWVQHPASQTFDLQEKGEIVKNTAFNFLDSLGNQMVEFQVDDFQANG
jgi:hypothetical protein